MTIPELLYDALIALLSAAGVLIVGLAVAAIRWRQARRGRRRRPYTEILRARP